MIPYFSLAAGFLTGKYRTESDAAGKARERMVKKYLNPRGMRILDALDAVANDTKSTPARVAIAWLIAQPSITAPIASATSIPQLEDLFESTRLQLGTDHLETLNTASSE